MPVPFRQPEKARVSAYYNFRNHGRQVLQTAVKPHRDTNGCIPNENIPPAWPLHGWRFFYPLRAFNLPLQPHCREVFPSSTRSSSWAGFHPTKKQNFFLATVVPPADGAVRVESYLGIVNGEAVIGANIFRDMFSSIRDVVGGRAGGYERALAGARQAAMDEMVAAAKELGATGVIGIDFDYEVLGETNGMMMVTVSGTAVKMAG